MGSDTKFNEETRLESVLSLQHKRAIGWANSCLCQYLSSADQLTVCGWILPNLIPGATFSRVYQNMFDMIKEIRDGIELRGRLFKARLALTLV